MTVGGPGRLLLAGGGEDGRFPERAPGVQQEQLQQVPCGFRLQGFQPPALGVFAHQRIPLGTDYRDREDKHPPALPPPAVGQKECGQEAGAGAGRARGGELGPAAQNRPDRQPGHDRGHLKTLELGIPKALPAFCHLPHPSPDPLGIPRIRPIYLGFASCLVFGLYLWGFYGEGELFVLRGPNSQNSWFSWGIPEFLIPKIPLFPGIPGCCSLGKPRIPNSPKFPLFLRFLEFAPEISQESSFPKIHFSWDLFPSQNSLFPGIPRICSL